MKKVILGIVLVLMGVMAYAQDEETEFCKALKSLPEVSQVEKLPGNVYKEKYVLYISQLLDKNNPEAGRFNQRVIVGFRGYDRPTVIETEGYTADYATNPNYREEISELLEANMVFVEYRFFSKSTPEPCNWDYMLIENSCDDLHKVRETIGKLFKGKWLSTGISKGGSTCTYYRAYYPNDVDASVAYVAPISRGMEDGRHEKFLNKKVGDKTRRAAMHDVMQEMMRRKPKLLPKLEEWCNSKELKFRIPTDQIYDYLVMEYEFSMWQWGTSPDKAPKKYENDDKWLNYLVETVGPDYFTTEGPTAPFFYQAIRELGYYGYSTKYLGKNASVKNTKGYLKAIMCKPEWKDVEFDPTVYKYTCNYLKKNDPTHIFIYGENDPWTASGVAGWLNCKKKQNMKVYVEPNGSHLTRIRTLTASDKKEVMDKINSWMK